MDPPKGIRMPGPQFSFVIVSEEFRFVSGHIDINGTVPFTPFAREAKIQRLHDLLALPSVIDDFAVHHLVEHAGSAARGMFFLAGHHVAGAHGSASLAAAFPDAYATQRGAG